jgi:hypothetical protein
MATLLENGYYYHYKHAENGDINNYAYEVLGLGLHTEGHHRLDDVLVIYRALYESTNYKNGKMYDLRPLIMFMENVTKEGKTVKRFQKISDEKIIAELDEIKKKMYGDSQ